MYKGKQGFQIFETGDVLRVGKGKAEWTVKGGLEGEYVHVVSEKGQARHFNYENLTLVRNVRDEDGGSETGGNKPSYEEIKASITTEEIRQNTRTQKGISKARKANRVERGSYSKLILAAIQLLPVVYGGTVSDKVKAKRRAKNKVARASRKANRC